MTNESSDDVELYNLTLQSEQYRLESNLHRLLSAQRLENPQDWHHLLAGVRKTLHTMHGRSLLCHEPGLNSSLGLTLTLAEYLMRGLVPRTLLVVPGHLLGFWHAQLQTILPHPITVATSWPTGELPENLLLPFEALQAPIDAEQAAGVPYPLIGVSMAGPLRRRRSTPWRNLLSLSPKYLLLQTGLPFLESPAELHGLLALLGVPELPPAARLKRQLGGPDTPISPAVRQELRPLLRPVVLRNSPSVTELTWPERQWRSQEFEHSLHFVQCRKEIWNWLRQHTVDPTTALEEGKEQTATFTEEEQETLTPILRATLSGPAATLDALEKLSQDTSWETQHTLFSGWQDQIRKSAHNDPRIKLIYTWLQENPRSRFLIFCHHAASRERLKEKLEEFLTPDSRVLLATDHDVPVFTGAIDSVIHFDFPWQPSLIDNRTHWMLQPHHNARQVRFFQALGCPTTLWWKTIQLRFKPQELPPGELEQCEVLIESSWQEPLLLWRYLHAPSRNDFFDALSYEYLGTRRRYRKIHDQNQRLFLDDYALS